MTLKPTLSTAIIDGFTIKGFAMDDERLKAKSDSGQPCQCF